MIGRIKRLYDFRHLLKQLVIKDIKLKYRRSFLGYLWSVLNPLLVMVVMLLVFSHMFRSDIENFPAYQYQHFESGFAHNFCYRFHNADIHVIAFFFLSSIVPHCF